MTFIQFSILLVSLVISIIFYFKHAYSYWKKKRIPYLEPSFPHGNLDCLLPRGVSIGMQSKKFYDELKKRNLKYGGVYAIAQPMLVVNDIDIIKDMFIKDFNHFMDRGLYHNESADTLSSNLFTQDGQKWKTLRTKFTPAFTSGKIKSMFDGVSLCAKNMLDFLKNHEDKNEVNIKHLSQGFTIDVIGNTVFGITCNCFQSPDTMFRKMAKRVFEVDFLLAINMCLAIYYPGLAKKLGVRMSNKDVSDFFHKIVKDNMSYRESNSITRPDFFQSLIDLKNLDNKDDGISIEEVVSQSFMFFVAGFETSSTTIMFCLYELAKNQEIQERVRKEIKKVMKQNNEEITSDGIKDMKYLEQVLDETLRMYPPNVTLTRKCTKNYKIKNTEDITEEGTIVLVPVFGIHRDSDIWDNPEEFNPERFNENNKKHIHPFAHLPFGGGPRNCIGMRFGNMLVKTGLAILLTNYRFHICPKTEEHLKFYPQTFILLTNDIFLKIENL